MKQMKQGKDIRNGSLYFNMRSKRVERALGRVNSQRMCTKSHREPAADVQVKDLRKARKPEVDSYIEESVPAL